MNRKYVKEAIGCMMISVVIVLLLLGMVAVFEYLEIHVPGSREMWIGLIGAVLGGAFYSDRSPHYALSSEREQ